MQDSLLSDVLYADFVSRVTMQKERKKYSQKIRKSSRALKVTLKKPNNLKIIIVNLIQACFALYSLQEKYDLEEYELLH